MNTFNFKTFILLSILFVTPLIADEEVISLNSALEAYKKEYLPEKGHKAFAQAPDGSTWGISITQTSREAAVDDALAKCNVTKSIGDEKCIVINTDGEWIPNPKPPTLKEACEATQGFYLWDNQINGWHCFKESMLARNLPFKEEIVMSDSALIAYNRKYFFEKNHKAFALGPGHLWNWSANHTSAEHAMKSALKSCRVSSSGKPCVIVNIDGKWVDQPLYTFKIPKTVHKKITKELCEGNGYDYVLDENTKQWNCEHDKSSIIQASTRKECEDSGASYLWDNVINQWTCFKKSDTGAVSERTACEMIGGTYLWDEKLNRWLCSNTVESSSTKLTSREVCQMSGGRYFWDGKSSRWECSNKNVVSFKASERTACKISGGDYRWNGSFWFCDENLHEKIAIEKQKKDCEAKGKINTWDGTAWVCSENTFKKQKKVCEAEDGRHTYNAQQNRWECRLKSKAIPGQEIAKKADAALQLQRQQKLTEKFDMYGAWAAWKIPWMNILKGSLLFEGCAPVPYKILSEQNGIWKLGITKPECDIFPKSANDHYIMELVYESSPYPFQNTYLNLSLYDISRKNLLLRAELTKKRNKKNKIYHGDIDGHAITMYLERDKNDTLEGYYFYDNYKKKIALKGLLERTDLFLNAYDNKAQISEIFSAQLLDKNISGNWQHKNKTLAFNVLEQSYENKEITCNEMQNFPEIVFSQDGIDLGSGHSSPISVDYACEGGLDSLEYLKSLSGMSEKIRSDYYGRHSGSIVYAHARYHSFELLEAGLAPAIYNRKALERQEYATDVYRMYKNQLNYFKKWSHESLYNFELYNAFWKEYRQAYPMLARHYQEHFNVDETEAYTFTENALKLYVLRAAGSFQYDLQGGEPHISAVEKEISNPDLITVNGLQHALNGSTSQETLDRALKTALLYKKPKSFITFLLDKGARINSGDESALFFALRDHESVELLLNLGAEVNYKNGFGKTALYYAIGFNDHSLVNLLLEHKADVNHTYLSQNELRNIPWENVPYYQSYYDLQHTKRTPLMHAAQNSDVEMIKLLLSKGAQLDATDETGFNALDYAYMDKNEENINYLTSLGLKKQRY